MQEREAHLADLMKAKLQKFVDGDKEGFRQQIQNEADRIAAVPFGVPMLEVIGWAPEQSYTCLPLPEHTPIPCSPFLSTYTS